MKKRQQKKETVAGPGTGKERVSLRTDVPRLDETIKKSTEGFLSGGSRRREELSESPKRILEGDSSSPQKK